MSIILQQSADDPIVTFVFTGASDQVDTQDAFRQAMQLVQELGTFYAVLDFRHAETISEAVKKFVTSLKTGDVAQRIHTVVVANAPLPEQGEFASMPTFTGLDAAQEYIRKYIATHASGSGNATIL